MDVGTGRRTGGTMDRRVERWTGGWNDGRTGKTWTDGWNDGRTDGTMDGQKGPTEGPIDGRKDGHGWINIVLDKFDN